VRNSPHVSSARETLVSHLVGTGIVPRAQAEDDSLRQALQSAWADWTDEADADGRCDVYGLQSLAAGALVDAGEVLVRRRRRRLDSGMTVPVQLQLIEPEHLDTTLNRQLGSGRVIRNGIEFDRRGRRAAYWLWPDHPGDALGRNRGQRMRVPASEIAHVFRPLRPGQVRGVPWAAVVLARLYELDQYEDAELVRKKTAAMFTAFLQESQGDSDVPPGQAAQQAFGGETDEADADGTLMPALEAGTTQVVPPGYEVKFSSPADVGDTYEVWIKQQLRAVAAGMGVTFEQLTGDLSDVNYSSIRAGLLEFRRRIEALQHNVLVFQLNRVVWRWFVEAAVAAGTVPARGFADNPREFRRVKWIPQGWSWVDPEKEIKAIVMAIRSGLVSREEAIAEFGYDIEEIDRELAREQASDLVLDSNPARTDGSGKLQPPVAAPTTGGQ